MSAAPNNDQKLSRSRRSSYASLSLPRLPKRSPSLLSLGGSKAKASTTTQASTIVAQPEPGAKLASAIDKLPDIPQQKAYAASVSDMKREREDENSRASADGGSDKRPRMANPQSTAETATRTMSTTPSTTSNNEGTNPAQASASLPQPATTSSAGTSPAPDAEIAPATLNPTPPTPILKPSAGSIGESTTPQGTPSGSWFAALSRPKSRTSTAPTAPETVANTAEAVAATPSATSSANAADILAAAQAKDAEAQAADVVAKDDASAKDTISATTTDTTSTTLTPIIITTTPTPAPSTPPSSSARTVPSRSPKRSWFGSTLSTSPGRSPPRGPHPLSHSLARDDSLNLLTPISIDEEVPRLTQIPELPEDLSGSQTLPPLIQSTPSDSSASRLATLNPAHSRFTLSIPLLGRPKLPLDKAVAAAQIEDVRGIGSETPVEERVALAVGWDVRESSETSQTPIEVSKDALPPTAITHTGDLPADYMNEKSGATSEAENSATTWWDYVGWGVGSQPGSIARLATGASDFNAPGITKSDSQEPPKTADSTRTDFSLISRSEAPPVSQLEGFPETKEKSSEPASADKSAPSVRSGESGGASAWLAPWMWYYPGIGGAGNATTSPTTKMTPLPPVSEESGGQAAPPGAETHVGADGRTDAERIKDAALARDSVATTAAAVAQAVTPGSPGALEQSAAENRGGWTAFFSNRAFLGKMITAEGEKSTEKQSMEVMDIDEEMEAETSKDAGKDAPVKEGRKSEGGKPAEREPRKKGAPNLPLTDSESIKRDARRRASSPAGSGGSKTPPSGSARKIPNLVLPTWKDTFHAPPRNILPPPPKSKVARTLKFMSNALNNLAGDEDGVPGASSSSSVRSKGKGKARGSKVYGSWLPKAWDVSEGPPKIDANVLRGAKRVVVIGVHGWFPGAVIKTMLGEPTGTSTKFVTMMVSALEAFQAQHNVSLESITEIPLEGEGTIEKRVALLYANLTKNDEWMAALHAADVVFIACHSQGSIVSTHLLDRLIKDGHIRPPRSPSIAGDIATTASAAIAGGVAPAPLTPKSQRICCLALCGIHLGPLRYLNSSGLTKPYFQYFESAAALELFEFQNTNSGVSKAYVKALKNVVDHGIKMVYIASLDDQVVPVYSGVFTSASHPLILRALYIDGDAYSSSDFLSNLLVLLIRIMNAGLSDSRLLVHLSEATAGSLSGIGHSTPYEELSTYMLAVNYLFLSDDGQGEHPALEVEPFDAATEQNDYEIPWALRDLIADERVAEYFAHEFAQLRDTFDDWRPKTAVLRDIKRKLQPIQRLSAFSRGSPSPPHKL